MMKIGWGPQVCYLGQIRDQGLWTIECHSWKMLRPLCQPASSQRSNVAPRSKTTAAAVMETYCRVVSYPNVLSRPILPVRVIQQFAIISVHLGSYSRKWSYKSIMMTGFWEFASIIYALITSAGVVNPLEDRRTMVIILLINIAWLSTEMILDSYPIPFWLWLFLKHETIEIHFTISTLKIYF